MPSRMNTQGFTLIELVAVIVLVGILAAVAAPKFTDLSSAARAANVKAMKLTLESGTKLLFARAAIENKIEGDDTLTVDGTTYAIHSGYLQAKAEGLSSYLDVPFAPFGESFVCPIDWCVRGNALNLPSGISAAPGRVAKVYPRGKSWDDACGAYYINRLNGSAPVIGVEITDC